MQPLSDGLTPHQIRSVDHPWMVRAYEALNDYFGDRGEMETINVIRDRLGWDTAQPMNGYAFLYELVVLGDAQGAVAAVRDHCVILDMDGIRHHGRPAVVHLSHIRVSEGYTGKSIVPRLHEYPILAAREALLKAGLPAETPIVLVAEVELNENGNAERLARLKLFKRAGYQPVDYRQVPYVQPDFRSPEVIEAGGGPKLVSLILMLWRIGQEKEETVDAGEIRDIVRGLYQMYGRSMWARHMQPVYASLSSYPTPGTPISLSWSSIFDSKQDLVAGVGRTFPGG